MGDVIQADFITRLDIPTERILNGAIETKLETAVVIGWDERGEFYFASSVADGGDVLWLMEMAKRRLLETAEKMEDGAA